MKTNEIILAIALLAVSIEIPTIVYAHCDTLDGPVVAAARAALEQGNVTPVLKWVKKDYEGEIRAVFTKTLAVRTKGAEAKDLADMHFFETLVRLHRAGEGAAYTGLRPVGADRDLVVAETDKALDNGRVDWLAKQLAGKVAVGIRSRFMTVIDARRHADESVEAGRRYVDAYVEFVHYVERLHLDATSKSVHRNESEAEDSHAD